MNFDSVIFDFDGTVADTGEGVFESVRYAIRMEGLPQPSDKEIRSFIGPPLSESFHSFFPEIDDDRVTQLIIHYRAKYSVDGIYKFKLYDGMESLLERLRSAGVKIAIGSSKPEVFINHILETCGLKKYFDAAVGAQTDSVGNDKADVVAEAIKRLSKLGASKPLMVGDRKYDIIGAHKCGLPCAGVTFGYGGVGEFEEYGADYIVNVCEEIDKIVIG